MAVENGRHLGRQAPIVQPGAPGEPSRAITSQQAIQIADTRFSPDDVRFMQDMIVHHQQAVDMTALVKERTNRPTLVDAAMTRGEKWEAGMQQVKQAIPLPATCPGATPVASPGATPAAVGDRRTTRPQWRR